MPQQRIALPIVTEWSIRRPYVYRYMPRAYVDEFFSSGKLRLSSFAAFAKHEDEERKDAAEGTGIIVNTDHQGEGQTLMAVMGQGHGAFVLCGSGRYSKDLSSAFGTDSGFRINDTTSFGCMISRMIPGFRGGLEGACIYADEKVVRRKAGRVNLENMKVTPEGKELDMGKMFSALGAIAGDDLFFLKKERYQHQAEYRLLWSSQSAIGDFIEVSCPDAIQFCTRFEDL
ncbi:MAG: hypothetical protein U1F81_24245 [Verrucomicrobiaceae bacterium]